MLKSTNLKPRIGVWRNTSADINVPLAPSIHAVELLLTADVDTAKVVEFEGW
jgi:hypothetical protein